MKKAFLNAPSSALGPSKLRFFASPRVVRYAFAFVRAFHVVVLLAFVASFARRLFEAGALPSLTLAAIGLAFALLSQIFAVNIVGHRFIGHGGFQPSRPARFLLLLWTVVVGLSSPLSSSLLHRRHHQNPDCDRDPHSPPHHDSWAMVKFFGRIYFNFLYEKNFSMREIMRESRRPFFIFFHRHGAYISLFMSFLLYFALGLDGLFFLQTVPVIVCFIGQFNLVYLTHVPHEAQSGAGERGDGNHSIDSVLANVLTLGEGAHAAHHQAPRKIFYETDRTMMFDLTGYVIQTLWKK